MGAPKKATRKSNRRVAPATSVEARENQMISLAVDLAEKQLSEGTASAQVITHYLRLGTTRERLEKEKLTKENLLLEARTKAYESSERIEALYEEAIKAMRSYSSSNQGGELDDSDD